MCRSLVFKGLKSFTIEFFQLHRKNMQVFKEALFLFICFLKSPYASSLSLIFAHKSMHNLASDRFISLYGLLNLTSVTDR